MGNKQPTAMGVITRHQLDWSGKVALITGCTSGMGVEIARALASTRATVYITGRNEAQLGKVADQLNRELGGSTDEARVKTLVMDQSSLQSVRTAAAVFLHQSTRLHLLICNAGLMNVPYSLSEEGADMQMAVNHISHQLLFTLLQPTMLASAPSRLVVVSSTAWYEFGPTKIEYARLPSVTSSTYTALGAYQQSKVANVLLAMHVHATCAERGLTAYSLNPGVVRTGLQVGLLVVLVALASPFLKSVRQGAATAVYCGVTPGLVEDSGQFFHNCAVTHQVAKRKVTRLDAERLYNWTQDFINSHAKQE